ncbi:MAG: hypothetical protein AAB152_18235 [Candidatus Coatesbacteria bacterium]
MFHMEGGLKAFWNVATADRVIDDAAAMAHGFSSVDLIDSYRDDRGRLTASDHSDRGSNHSNPWRMPVAMSEAIQDNLSRVGKAEILVNDIELLFSDDPNIAYKDAGARVSSGSSSASEFADRYLEALANWYILPCRLSRSARPNQRIGIYGRQPIKCNYARKPWMEGELDRMRQRALWRRIDPFIDFAIVGFYYFRDTPDSIYYNTAGVEENAVSLNNASRKPLYAYAWLRLEDRTQKEVSPALAEAAAILPYFYGASSVVLWGYEPKATTQPYERLVDFMEGLKRVAAISAILSKAVPRDGPSAKECWWNEAPLVRVFDDRDGGLLVLAAAPRLAPGESVGITVPYQGRAVSIKVRAQHCTIARVTSGHVTEY